MDNIFQAIDFLGQNLRFRDGRRLIRNGVWYQMDGTDGRGRLMLLTTADYRTLRAHRNAGEGTPQYIADRYFYVEDYLRLNLN